MNFLNHLDVLVPKTLFSFFSGFWVRVTSGARGSVGGIFGGAFIQPFFGGGGSSQRAVSTPPPPRQVESPPTQVPGDGPGAAVHTRFEVSHCHLPIVVAFESLPGIASALLMDGPTLQGWVGAGRLWMDEGEVPPGEPPREAWFLGRVGLCGHSRGLGLHSLGLSRINLLVPTATVFHGTHFACNACSCLGANI